VAISSRCPSCASNAIPSSLSRARSAPDLALALDVLAGPLSAAVAPAMLGAHGVPRGVQIIAESFEDRTAIACAAMLEALGASFKPADGLALSAAARPTAKQFAIAAHASCKSGGLA
jgi:hypothetical protein